MIDLHTHSIYSDGTLTPAQLITLAKETGVTHLALCDHNTVAGLPEFLAAAKDSQVTAVPGIEFSTDYGNTELHILALFVKPRDHGSIQAVLTQMLRDKDRSNEQLVQALSHAGLPMSYAEIKAGTPGGQVNRAVIAAHMVQKGYCARVQEAFKLWLSPKRGYYQPPKRPDAFAIIRLIRSLGAVSVLAHPFLNLKERELRIFLEEATKQGLDAMEVYYPLFDEAQRNLAREIAWEYGLAISGGSDFHGENKPDIALGTGKGNLEIPGEIFTGLLTKNEQNLKFI